MAVNRDMINGRMLRLGGLLRTTSTVTSSVIPFHPSDRGSPRDIGKGVIRFAALCYIVGTRLPDSDMSTHVPTAYAGCPVTLELKR
ncbi:hypothetical protein BH23CHL2_BH23CHL2_29610 [soil metagenome]